MHNAPSNPFFVQKTERSESSVVAKLMFLMNSVKDGDGSSTSSTRATGGSTSTAATGAGAASDQMSRGAHSRYSGT